MSTTCTIPLVAWLFLEKKILYTNLKRDLKESFSFQTLSKKVYTTNYLKGQIIKQNKIAHKSTLTPGDNFSTVGHHCGWVGWIDADSHFVSFTVERCDQL